MEATTPPRGSDKSSVKPTSTTIVQQNREEKKQTISGSSEFDPTKYGLLNLPGMAKDRPKNTPTSSNTRPQSTTKRSESPHKSLEPKEGRNEPVHIAKPAKDAVDIKELLAKEREKSLQHFGQVAIRLDAEKDAETTARQQQLTRGRAVPNGDTQKNAIATFSSGGENVLDLARAPGDINEDIQENHESLINDGTELPRGRDANEQFSLPSEGFVSEDSIHGFKLERGDGSRVIGATWDGSVPTPFANWGRRPALSNDDRSFTDFLHEWVQGVTDLTTLSQDNSTRHIISEDVLLDTRRDLLPDGLTLVPKEQTVFSMHDADRFGYRHDAFTHAEYTPAPFNKKDWRDWEKLDQTDPQNAEHSHETSAMLCKNIRAHLAKEQVEKMRRAEQIIKGAHDNHFAPVIPTAAIVPRPNIYVRPAVIADMPQVMDIFNSHIQHSARPSELDPIPLIEMQNRLADVENENLPFLVAILKDFKTSRKAQIRSSHVEKIVGFGCAALFSAIQNAEQYTAEMEIYVHREWLRQGIGSCLLDKMLEPLDPGYIPRQGYLFTCDPEARRHYGPGGKRDLLSSVFVVRHWDNPRTGEISEYMWLKKWLEKFGFEEQGYLRRVGMNKDRVTNMAYLVRKSTWEPGLPD
ncbi:MAG: hypothetical protein Q9227_000448 [Pyrenula ochraceoflavens]